MGERVSMLGVAGTVDTFCLAQEIIVASSSQRTPVRPSVVVAFVIACAVLAGCDLAPLASKALSQASTDDGAATAVQITEEDAARTNGSADDDGAQRDAAPVEPLGIDDGTAARVEAQDDGTPRGSADGSRQALLDELEGFGEETTGGLSGSTYVVTNLRDSGPGSLRAGAEADGARWIEFADDLAGTIDLDGDIRVRGSKTIDGRGSDITLSDGGLRVVGDNVIVAYLRFVETPKDAVSFYGGRRDGWVHHSTFVGNGDSQDGAVDIADRSTDITVSWNRFENWNKTSLATWEHYNGESFGPSVAKSRFTYHHNYFSNSQQRQPLVRTALLHSYNNWFDAFGSPGTGVATQACNLAEVLSQHNVYDDEFDRPAIKTFVGSKACSAPAFARSEGDVFTGNPERELREPHRVFDARDSYDYELDPAGDELRRMLARSAGA